MASIQSRLFNVFLRLINKKGFAGKFAGTRLNIYNSPEPPSGIHKKCEVSKYQFSGRNVFTLKPKDNNTPRKHILYLHGGAYNQNFLTYHWEFIAEMAQRTGSIITAPDYPLAPEYTYKDSFDMVSALYRNIEAATDARDFILMGDSAGGGFALALAQKMQEEETAQAGQIILLSPWLDLSLTNPLIEEMDPLDPFLQKESLRQAANAYAGGTSLDCTLLSPINGALEGLGRISLFIGSREILVADARKFNSIAQSKGISINYYEYPDMIHGWMLLRFPESKKAKQQIIDLIGRG